MLKIIRSFYLDKQIISKVARLSKRTGVSQATLVREGVDLMLKKREKQLSSKQRKGKTQDHQMDKRKILKMVPKLRKVKKSSR
jgi:predicted DNA-binding protein